MLEISEKTKNQLALSFIFIISVFGLWLRLINLGKLSFWSDDAFTYSAVSGILKHGYPVFPSGLIYFKQIFYSYLAAVSAFFFGLNEFGLRLPSVLFGILVVPLTYRAARDWFNRPVALVAAVFMVFNYWSFEFSREARYYTTLQFFYLLSVYLFYRGFIKEEKKYQKWALVSFIASIFTFRISLFLILNFLFLIILKGFKKFFKKELLLNLLGVAVVFGGALIFEVFFWQVGRHVQHTTGAAALFKELFSLGANFFRQFEWLFKRMSLVLLVGILGFFWQWGRNLIRAEALPVNWAFGLLNFFVPLALMSFGRAHYQPRYVFYLLPFFAILYSQSAFWLATLTKDILFYPFKNSTGLKKISPLFLWLIFFLIIGVSMKNVNPRQLFLITQRTEGDPIDSRFAPSTANLFHHDFRSAAFFVKSHLQPNDAVISLYAIYHLIYAGRADYWLWTMSEEGLPAIFTKEGQPLDTYSGAKMIRDLATLKKILQTSSGRRIWIISTYSLNQPGHITPDIKKFLKSENPGKTVYTNPAGDSAIWLWPGGAGSL